MIRPVFPTKISQFFGAASVAFMVLVVIAVGLILANSRALEQDTYDESGIGSMQLRVHFEALQGALALVEASGSSGDPSRAVLQFDILYERVRALPERPSYQDLLDEELLALNQEILTRLEREVPFIDAAASGDGLALQGMRSRLNSLRLQIERLAHRPVQIASELRDRTAAVRKWIAGALAGVIAAFMITGTIFVLMTRQQRNIAEQRRQDVEQSRDALSQKVEELEKVTCQLQEVSNAAQTTADKLRTAQGIQMDALQSMHEGFALWGADNRLMICNTQYADIHTGIDDLLHPGLRYEDFLTIGYARAVFECPSGEEKTAIKDRLDRFGALRGAFEERLGCGRWVRVTERKASNGRTVVVVADITEEKTSELSIKRMAETDSLTGLANRAVFLERLDTALADADETSKVAILLLDLDDFKTVNDTMGHIAGDALLRQVAERLKTCCRAADTIARLGGDEFAIICKGLQQDADAGVLADQIVAEISRPYVVNGRQVRTGASIGITICAEDPGDCEQLLRNADVALYQSKDSNRGNYLIFDAAMDARVRALRSLERDLHGALEREEFKLVYQPQIDLRSGRVVGAEALLRWHHPTRGVVPPLEFIPIAEASYLTVPIGEWVIREACRQTQAWRAQGVPPLTVAVNVSAQHFRHQHLIDCLRLALQDSGLAPRFLELEITESAILDKRSVNVLQSVRDLGVKIAVDDFGTGYSSLARIKTFPVNRLKIDQAFVRDVDKDPQTQAICAAIVSLGTNLGLEIVAEGVETHAQAREMARQGADLGQGYLYARPLDPEAFAAFANPDGAARQAAVDLR
jgi:diguanylate cyclase (GGDEF)-like protein